MHATTFIAVLIVLLAGAVIVVPLASEAQQPTRPARVVWVQGGTPELGRANAEAFRAGLKDYGHVDGQNIILEIRYAEGRLERIPQLLSELLQQKVDVILAGGYQNMLVARNATSTIPIVGVACDPVEALVASIARPGGNVTGVTCVSSELAMKRVQLFHEALPGLSKGAVLYNPGDPNKAIELKDTEAAARALGLTLKPVEVRRPDELEAAFAAMRREGIQAVITLMDLFTYSHRQRIVELARKERLAGMYGFSDFVEGGGLLSYGTNILGMFRRAAFYVDRILKGTKPGDLPIEQPTQFELVINLKTAKALRLTIPPTVLQRADQVIE